MATGAGKTIITATLSKICEKYGDSIIIKSTKSVTQTEEDYKNVGLDVGVTIWRQKRTRSINILL